MKVTQRLTRQSFSSSKVKEYSLEYQHKKMRALNSPNHSKVALIGGSNLSGALLASFLSRVDTILPDHVRIFDRNTKFGVEQFYPHYAFDSRDREDVEHYVLKLLTQYHKFEFETMETLDPEKNSLTTFDKTFTYDYLVVCNDPVADLNEINGLQEALEDPRGSVYSLHSIESTEKAQSVIFSGAGGEARGVVFYCAGRRSKNQLAAVNAALLFKQQFGDSKGPLYFLTEEDKIFDLKDRNSDLVSDYIKLLLEKKGFTLKTGVKLNAVNSARTEVSLKFKDGSAEKLEYNVLYVDPPHCTSEHIINSPLFDQKSKRFDFNQETLQHNRFSNIFITDRALNLGSSLPQSFYGCSVESAEICRVIMHHMAEQFGQEEGRFLNVMKKYTKFPLFEDKGKVTSIEYTLDGKWEIRNEGRIGYWTEMYYNPWMLKNFLPKGRLLLPKGYSLPDVFRKRF